MKIQKCDDCVYYSAYYKQWYNSYEKLNHGFCSKIEKPKLHYDSCELFNSNEQIEQSREERRLLALEQALKSINDIANILKDKYSGN
jgi:hypothetical protein